MNVGKGKVVSMHYSLKDQTGKVLETTKGKRPFEFILGEGIMAPGLEEGILGLRPGEKKAIVVSPSDGYGERHKEAFFKVHRDEILQEKFEVGGKMRKVFSDGRSETFRITGFVDDWIYMDGNHPLAGKELHYEVKILEVRVVA